MIGCALALSSVPAEAATLTDSVNHTVTIPTPVTALIPAGAPAQILLHALALDRLVGLVERFKPDHAIYVDPHLLEAPQIPMLARTAAPGDVAMVAALKPDLVVDYGNASQRYASADGKIEKTLKVPAVLFGGGLAEAPHVLRTLGTAIGAQARGEDLARKVETILEKAKPLSSLADADRVPVYLARGTEGLTAARAGTSFDEPLRLAGGRNVVEGGTGTFKKMTVADVVALKPAVVIFAERDALSSPLHAALPKGTRFLLDKGEPYSVLTGPPSLNRLVGLAALASLLYPKIVSMDPDEIARVETALFPIPPGLAIPAPLEEHP